MIDFGELDDGASYIVMEWLEGRSLSELLRAEERLPLERARRIARGIGRALAAAHARGIVHRDLKPDNIFLVRHDDDADFVKVLDFGIAKLMGDTTDVKTRAGAILGTPYYLLARAVPGARGRCTRRRLFARRDPAIQLVTGRLPFEGARSASTCCWRTCRGRRRRRARSSRRCRRGRKRAFLLQALAKDPEQRFARVEALVTAFCDESALPPLSRALPPAPAAAGDGRAGDSRASGSVRTHLRAVPARRHPRQARPGHRRRRRRRARRPLCSWPRAIRRQPPTAAPAPPATAEPGATAPGEPVGYAGAWRLAHTDCPTGSMPHRVTVTQSGAAFTVHGGVPTTGEIAADGRFTARNALGVCRGAVSGSTSKETCTNAFRQSCHATYERTD